MVKEKLIRRGGLAGLRQNGITMWEDDRSSSTKMLEGTFNILVSRVKRESTCHSKSLFVLLY